jgi:site-specific DNA recombinase
MHKRAVLYARVSTDDQADKGYSLPSQIELCRKYAERLGFVVVAELVEDHSGATPIAERPEGKKMTAMVKSRQADAVVAYQVDRLSRDIVDLLATVRIWIRAGIEVHACDIADSNRFCGF